MDVTIPKVLQKGSSEVLDGPKTVAKSHIVGNAVGSSIDATVAIDGEKETIPSTTHTDEGIQVPNEYAVLSTIQGINAESDDMPVHDFVENAVDHNAFRPSAASEAGSYDISVDSNVNPSIHA